MNCSPTTRRARRHRLQPPLPRRNQSARNLMQRRQEILNDITDTVGATFLGMTYGCARCHDHKFDPILHKDYYRLQAFFANTRAKTRSACWRRTERPTSSAVAAWEAEDRSHPRRDALTGRAGRYQGRLLQGQVRQVPEEIQQAITTGAGEANAARSWQMYQGQAANHLDHERDGTGARTERRAEPRNATRNWKRELPNSTPSSRDPPLAQTMIDDGREAPNDVRASRSATGTRREKKCSRDSLPFSIRQTRRSCRRTG